MVDIFDRLAARQQEQPPDIFDRMAATAVAEPPAQTPLPGPQYPGQTPRDIRVSRGTGAARPDLAGVSALKRAGKQFVNKVISDPLKNIAKRSNVGMMNQQAEYLTTRKRRMAELGVNTLPREEELRLQEEIHARAGSGIPSFDVPPPASKFEQYAIDTPVGIAAFVAKLWLAKQALGTTGGTTEGMLTWEMLNLVEGQTPGKGALVRGALGAIEKVPTTSLLGKGAKITAGGGLFGGLTAAEGGSFEDIAVSAAIGGGFQAWGIHKQTQWLKSFKGELLKAEKAKVQGKKSSGMSANNQRFQQDMGAARTRTERAKAISDLHKRHIALVRNTNTAMTRAAKSVDKAMDVIARKLHHGKLKGKEPELARKIVEKGLTPESVAEVGKVKLPATKGEAKFAKAEAKALKDIASSDPKRRAAGNRVLDFLRKAEKGKGKATIEGIPEPTVAQKVVKAVKRPAKAVERAAKQAEVEMAKRPKVKLPVKQPPQQAGAARTQPSVAERPIKAGQERVKVTKAQRQHKAAVEQLFKKGKPVAQDLRNMYPDLVAKYEKGPFWKPEFDKPRTADDVRQLIKDWEGFVAKSPTKSNEAALQGWKTKLAEMEPAPTEAAKELVGPTPTAAKVRKAKAFESDPVVSMTTEGKSGFAGVADRPGGKAEKPWLDLKKTESPDKQIEDFFGRTKKMPSSRRAGKLLQKIKAGLRERFIFAHHLPDTPEAAVARDRIRTMPEERRAAGEKATRDLVAILDGDGTVKALDNAGLDLLRRKVFVQDLLHEAEVDRSIAGDMSMDSLKAENTRLNDLISKVPSVKKAYEARQQLWDNISKDLYERGVISEEARDNPAYVRHFVLDYIDNNRRPVSSRKKKLSEPYRAYGKKRTGSRRDISTDYLEVEVRAMADIYRDNAVEDMANAVGKRYDKRAEFAKIAKAEDATIEEIAAEQGYVEWHYKRPNLFYHALTLSESKIAALIESTAEQAGEVLQIPRSVMRDALVVGRRKGWVIPEWLATQLDDLPVNQRSNMVVRSFTKPFVQWWKRWILRVNPFRYNARNQLGDTERLNASGQMAAIKKIPEGVKLLITKKGTLYEQMKKYGVAGSSLWHEMNDAKKVKEFERFKNISKQKTFKSAVKTVFGAPIKLVSRTGQLEQDLTQFREDILRAAVFLHNLEKMEAGKKVRHWAGRIADIEAIAKDSIPRAAAKLSRETLIDYGSFTPFENDVFRNGLLPFYSFFKRNFTFWPRAIRNAAKEGAAGKPVVAGATIAGFNIAKWLVRVMWAYAIAYLWNHRDEEATAKEESLAFWLRAQPHINIGKMTVWGETALNDYMEWIDYEAIAGVNWRREAGFLNNKQAGIEAARIIAQGPVNKVYQTLNPFVKGTQTAITGQVTWPSVFEPHFVAKPASRKSLERAVVGILGTDANRFYQSAKGDRAFNDTLSAYFAGWWGKPTAPETLAEQIKKTKEWSTLKRKSKTTGRKRGEAKKGKEARWQEAQIRDKALKGQR